MTMTVDTGDAGNVMLGTLFPTLRLGHDWRAKEICCKRGMNQRHGREDNTIHNE